jgi:hypothetical protein
MEFAELSIVQKQDFENQIDILKKDIEGITGNIVKCSKQYVYIIQTFPGSKELIQERIPEVGIFFWKILEKIGTGNLDPRLLNDRSYVGDCLRKLSGIDQKIALDGPIDLLLPRGDILKVMVHNLTESQCLQVFNKDQMRSLPEQKAYLEDINTIQVINKKKMDSDKPYTISLGKVIFHRPVQLNDTEIFDIYCKIKRK